MALSEIMDTTKAYIKKGAAALKRAIATVTRFIKDHPLATAAIVAAIAVLLTMPILGALGFGTAGLTVGGVASICQSAAMGGYGLVIVHGVIVGVTLLVELLASTMKTKQA